MRRCGNSGKPGCWREAWSRTYTRLLAENFTKDWQIQMIQLARIHSVLKVAILLCLAPHVGQSQDFTLRRAIDLALTHSPSTGVARAGELASRGNSRAARSYYVPQVTLGSGLGYAYGFPLSLEGSAPTIFNVTAQSGVISAAQRDFIRAADLDVQASSSQTRDIRGKVLLDVISSYVELNRWERELPVLYAERKVTKDMLRTTQARVQEGVEASLEETKSKLTVAQADYRIAQAEGSADLLRHHLAELTGAPLASVTTVASSIPAMPPPVSDEDEVKLPPEGNAAVEMAELRAKSEQLRARGEHKALYPTADFAAQYGLISTTFTDYEQFFRPGSFRSNNLTFALVLRLPLLNDAQRARAQTADAEALRAKKQAEVTKMQLTDEAIRMRDGVRELSASRDVAQLQYQLAQAQLDAAQTRMDARTATLRELQDASLKAVQDNATLMDSDFETERAQLQLLYATGGLDAWSATAK